MAFNVNKGISYSEARKLMRSIAEECAAKEELAQDIHRRIYMIDMALAKEKEEKNRLGKALEQNRIRPSMPAHEAGRLAHTFGSLVAHISDLHQEVERAYREMYLEYGKIDEMRRIYAAYARMAEKYETMNPK